jgi:hypothetical protein
MFELAQWRAAQRRRHVHMAAREAKGDIALSALGARAPDLLREWRSTMRR